MWRGNVVSPFDKNSSVYKCANGKYKCRNTNKYFTVLTGSIFEATKIPLQKWFMAIYFITAHKKGISSHQLARDIEVTQKTAWFMLHRIRFALQHKSFQKQMEGIVEADETYVGGKEGNKHKSKRTGDTHGRSTKVKAPVFGLVQRGGDVFAKVVADTKSSTLQPIIGERVKKGARLMTDEWQAYNGLHSRYNHQIVNHGAKQYAEGDVYTNTLEGFWSWIKRAIMGIYHKTSKKHLQRYVDEVVFRYNTRKQTSYNRFNMFLEQMQGFKITYSQLIG
ncbi:IS1595 family transposase [Mucilaginibacter defluvii]|uniref:IS1595 family transposase n=2 Tax=Mucilaginibacter defluvii TaxID=1196019 RepID=A0ABP9FMU3_9SPHI